MLDITFELKSKLFVKFFQSIKIHIQIGRALQSRKST